MWIEKSSLSQNQIKSERYIKIIFKNHFSIICIDLILAQVFIYLDLRYVFGPNGMSFKKKRKTALNSLTQSYVTVISFCYYATDNYILVIKAKYD